MHDKWKKSRIKQNHPSKSIFWRCQKSQTCRWKGGQTSIIDTSHIGHWHDWAWHCWQHSLKSSSQIFFHFFLSFLLIHNSQLVCMVGITYLFIDTIFAFYGYIDLFGVFYNRFLLLSWIFEHDCLDACCFGYLLCMCFKILYLFLFSPTDQVSQGMAL